MTEAEPKYKKGGQKIERGSKRWWEIVGTIITTLPKIVLDEEQRSSEAGKREKSKPNDWYDEER
jgi:hypothetical protein